MNDFLGGTGDVPAESAGGRGDLRRADRCAVTHMARRALERGGRRARRRGPDDRATVRRRCARSVGDARGATLRVEGGDRHQSRRWRRPASGSAGSRPCAASTTAARRGQAFWAAQLDVAPIAGRLRPVAFVDAGQAGRPGDLFSSDGAGGRGRGRLAVQRGAALRSQSPAHARHRRQGAIRHRRPGGAMRRGAGARLARVPGRRARLRAAGAGTPLGAARLEVRWTGADTAAFGAPATAEWCDTPPPDRDPRHLGRHGARPRAVPTRARVAARAATRSGPRQRPTASPPAAALALRWFSQDRGAGLPGRQRQRDARRARPTAACRAVSAKARSINSSARPRLTGSFDGLVRRPCRVRAGSRAAAPHAAGSTPPGDTAAPTRPTRRVD